jgi:hypothetical protein
MTCVWEIFRTEVTIPDMLVPTETGRTGRDLGSGRGEGGARIVSSLVASVIGQGLH